MYVPAYKYQVLAPIRPELGISRIDVTLSRKCDKLSSVLGGIDTAKENAASCFGEAVEE